MTQHNVPAHRCLVCCPEDASLYPAHVSARNVERAVLSARSRRLAAEDRARRLADKRGEQLEG